ncbi:unnamed protein product [Didymodactylos carnosus]|uniref:FLYWCH-type domain-containing protein n=1 Tax=Didymodactylos carnosus TaxID=1234261 RepID=A0A813WUA9_9BILA|nr:unnamed protein product [Didymodactylos carnosus]CAF3643793.1 unnamed protein product [Didymodactylos carnosus]
MKLFDQEEHVNSSYNVTSDDDETRDREDDYNQNAEKLTSSVRWLLNKAYNNSTPDYLPQKQDKTNRFTENKTYWRCIYYNSQKCHARLHTCNITNNVITPPSDHTCKSNGITGELRKFNEDLWYRTMNTQETPDLIITHCCKKCNILTFS